MVANAIGMFGTGYGTGGALPPSEPYALTDHGQTYYGGPHLQTEKNLSLRNDLAKIAASREESIWETLSSLAGAGYQDADTIDRAKGNYGAARGSLDEAANVSRGMTQTGGDDGAAKEILGRLGQVAKRGALGPQEYQQILASTRQDTMDMGRGAAESTYNRSLGGSGSPFAAASIMSKTTADAGRNLASARGDLNKFQAQTRMQADATAAPLAEGLAGNRLTAANQLGDLAGKEIGMAGDQASLDMKNMPSYFRDILGEAKSGLGRVTKGPNGLDGINLGSLFREVSRPPNSGGGTDWVKPAGGGGGGTSTVRKAF